MSETTKKRRVSLIVNLIVLIGLGIAGLTAVQVAVLSQLAKKDKRFVLADIEKGFDALHCTVGGQTVTDWGDTFTVGLR